MLQVKKRDECKETNHAQNLQTNSYGLDVVLDGIYIVRLARVLNRFWIEARIIRLMLKLYMVAVVKGLG